MSEFKASDIYARIQGEMRKKIAGKSETIELMIIAMVADGHAILEGVPGVAKTTMTKALAATVKADFKRIQGTSDLEPKDVMGYSYIDSDSSVKFMRGPIFTNILLIDELNRVPQKTMSAMLETLEERQVTIGGVAIPLLKPFITFATQNPLKVEGTEQIPKVLADRFLMKIDVDYPNMEEEEQMLRMKEKEEEVTENVIIDTAGVIALQEEAKKIEMPDEVDDYIAKIVNATRTEMHVVMGASPRADIAFMMCGKAKAYLEGRSRVEKSDIKSLAKPILSHRITVRSTGGVGVRGIIDGILATLG
jgi:MoxR-like ATPase